MIIVRDETEGLYQSCRSINPSGTKDAALWYVLDILSQAKLHE